MGDAPRAGIYARISRDRENTNLGVDRQVEECAALAKRSGWNVVRSYIDPDISAYSGKRRPQFEAMRADVVAGRIDLIVAWHQDRLFRSAREVIDFADLLREHTVMVHTVMSGNLDLSTSSGRTTFLLMGVIAANESDQKADRLRSKHTELAMAGLWKGGPRPYGYHSVGDGQLVVDQAEAQIIREVARRVLAGETLYSIARDLNDRAVPTAHGKEWRSGTLRLLLTSPTVAGKREHRGEVVSEAVWDAILEIPEWEALRLMLPRASGERVKQPVRKYLLTGGLARCGRCGAALHSYRKSSQVRAMVCLSSPGSLGCGRLQIVAEPVEQMVSGAVLYRLDSQEFRDHLAVSAGGIAGDDRRRQLTAELALVDQEELEVGRSFGAGRIPLRAFEASVAVLGDRRDAAKAELATLTTEHASIDLLGRGGELSHDWESLDMHQRRAVIDAIVERVVIAPATKRGPKFQAGRVQVIWRA